MYSENRPTFKKPPLQYWVTAWLLDSGGDIEVALRLPSYLFGIGLIAATGMLAWIMLPSNPWVITAAMLLQASSGRFWENALSALLDSGATFLTIVAIAGTYAALRQPRWWYLVAAAMAVGAWQKAPIQIAFVAAILLVLVLLRGSSRAQVRRSLGNRHFWVAAVIGLVIVLFWPLLQMLRFGPESFDQAYASQMVNRFSPFAPESGSRTSFFTLIISGEPVMRIFAVLALFWLPWKLQRPDLAPLPLILAVYAVVVAFASGYVSPRYSLLFLPMELAALAAVIFVLVPKPWMQLALIAFFSAVSLGPFKSGAQLHLLISNQTQYVAMLQGVASALAADESLVACNGNRGRDRIRWGAFSYYASGGRPFYRIDSADHLRQIGPIDAAKQPLRGVCSVEQLAKLRPILLDPIVIENVGDYVHWTATGLVPLP